MGNSPSGTCRHCYQSEHWGPHLHETHSPRLREVWSRRVWWQRAFSPWEGCGRATRRRTFARQKLHLHYRPWPFSSGRPWPWSQLGSFASSPRVWRRLSWELVSPWASIYCRGVLNHVARFPGAKNMCLPKQAQGQSRSCQRRSRHQKYHHP